MNNPIPLPPTIRKNGFTYTRLREGKRSFLYEQRGSQNRVVGYEVFRRKTKAERIVKGKTLPAKIMFPNNEAFGKWAWSFYTLEKARRKFEELES